MNFWSLDQKIWEGFAQTQTDRHRQTTRPCYFIVHRRKLFVGDKNASNLVRKRKGGWPMVRITSAVTATALVDCMYAYITLNYFTHSYWSRQRLNIPVTNMEDRSLMRLNCVIIQWIVKKFGNAESSKQILDYIWLRYWQISERIL